MSRPALMLAVMASWLWVWAGAERSMAHPLNPALFELRELRGAAVEVLWRVPLSQPINAPLYPVLPDGCREVSAPTFTQTEQSLTTRWRLDCGGRSLVGGRIGVQGLSERQTDALVRIHLADGRLIQAVLRGDSPFLTIPQRARLLTVARDYLQLGLEHILTGFDHLLFVLGLVLLVHGRRLLLWTVTAFTVGHSITLSLAVLGFVRIPPAPVEVLIACSIFIVGVELTREMSGCATWTHRLPWAMALAFGLLHGLGFAGALAQVGLPADEIPLALFSFNVGIEVGQLLFVGLVLAARVALRMLPVRWPQASALIPAYAIGSLAAYWVFERVWGIAF
jgi:hydrogenase/urease accessory protein HupE